MSDEKKGSTAMLAGHPVSTWSALIVGVIALYTSHTETQDVRVFSEKVASHTDMIGGGHYEAIVDLRKKVDYIFGKVIEHDAKLRTGPVLPPGPPSPKPPEQHWTVKFLEGNCESCPECCTGDPDAGSHEEEVHEEADASSPAEEDSKSTDPVNVEQVPFDVDKDMKIKWKPLNQQKLDLKSTK